METNGHHKRGIFTKAYNIDLGLSDKEKREKITKTNGGFVTFGEAMTGGIEAHKCSSSIFLQTKTPGKTEEGEDDRSTEEKTIGRSIYRVCQQFQSWV